jgi:hypothetical protein
MQQDPLGVSGRFDADPVLGPASEHDLRRIPEFEVLHGLLLLGFALKDLAILRRAAQDERRLRLHGFATRTFAGGQPQR